MGQTTKIETVKSFLATHKTLVILLLIIAVGAWLRFAGAAWGLPLRLHPDEGVIVDNAIEMADAHRYEVTGDFDRPDHTPIKLQVLLFWVMKHAIQAVSIGQLLDGDVALYISQFGEQKEYAPPRAQLFILNCQHGHPISFGRANDELLYVEAGRMLSALFGVVGIVFAWLIGKQVHKGAGLICALLFAVFPCFIEHSHYITPEMYQAAFTLAMTYFSLIYLKNPTYKILFCACVPAALAFCTKYPALYSFPIIIAAILCADFTQRRETSCKLSFKAVGQNLKNCLIAVVMFGALVFAISPVLLLDLTTVYVHVKHEARSHHLGVVMAGYWGNLLSYIQNYAGHAGAILFVFGIVGLFFLWKEHKQMFILLLLGTLYAPLIAAVPLRADRWGVPFYAFALILAAMGVWQACEWLRPLFGPRNGKFFVLRLRHSETPKFKIALQIAVLLVLAVSFANLCLSSIAMAMRYAVATDTRNASALYAMEIGATDYNTISDGYTPVGSHGTAYNGFVNNDLSQPAYLAEVEYVMVSSYMYSRFYDHPEEFVSEVAFYETLKANKSVLREFAPVTGENVWGLSANPNDIVNIVNKIKTISGYLKGGYAGPRITIYQY